MSTLILICLFFSICLLAGVTKWYLAGAGLIAVAIGVEVWSGLQVLRIRMPASWAC